MLSISEKKVVNYFKLHSTKARVSKLENPPELVKNIKFEDFFGVSANAAPKWLECIGEALGLNFFRNLSTVFAEGGERAAKKILGEVVKRYLGPAAVVGVVATYLWCMW